jgi:uncharacterized protein
MNPDFILHACFIILIGSVIGGAIGMTGIGGGALILPVLIHILRIDPVSAVGTGLVIAMITKINGAFIHFKLKTIRIRRARYFLVGSIPGVLLASRIVNHLANRYETLEVNTSLQMIIGIILLVNSVILIAQIIFVDNGLRCDEIVESKNIPISVKKRGLAISSGVIIGILMGTTSVGGGVFIIPLFILLLDSSCIEAIGSSIAISLVLNFLGAIIYFSNGYVNFQTALLVCIGSLPGVIFGSRIGAKIPALFLQIIVIVLIAGSGISMFF